MKIIDILNKKANEELKDGFKFEYKHTTYTYHEETNEIIDSEQDTLEESWLLGQILNDEVEVIEEKKEIEELGFIEKTVEYCDGTGYTNTKPASAIDMHNKINELVRAVNKINKQLEEIETEDIDTVERELNKMF